MIVITNVDFIKDIERGVKMILENNEKFVGIELGASTVVLNIINYMYNNNFELKTLEDTKYNNKIVYFENKNYKKEVK